MDQTREGTCQCGAVRYEVKGDPIMVVVCHCTDCQRHSGSAFGMSMIVPREAFRLLRGDLKKFVRKADSGLCDSCAFCPECGTRIYQEPEAISGMVSVKPGTLDDTSFVRPTLQTWTARKQPWLKLNPDVPTLEQQ